MEAIASVFNFILNDLGSVIFLPLIMLILGLAVGMKITKSFSAAISFGVALSAMGLVIGYMTGAIGPVAEAMTQNLGKTFDIVDSGWVTLASITWSWRYAFLLFPVQIIINLVMYFTKLTKTINVDMWNIWGKVFGCILVQAVTGSMALGLVVAGVRVALELILGDALQPRIEELTGIKGVTCPHSCMFFMATLYPIDMLLRKIPALDKYSFDAKSLRSKIGVFAENHVMGFILGILFGLVGKYTVIESLMLGITCATALVLLPTATKIFMQALSPISEACTSFMKRKAGGREIIVGLDVPIILGSAEIWVCAMINVPFTLLWAIILPGNRMLPFASIINLAISLCAYYVCKGNLVRMLILAITVGSPVYLLCGTVVAPAISALAVQNGFIQAGTLVSSAMLDGPVYTYITTFFTQAFTGNFLPIIVAAYFIFGMYITITDLKKAYAKPTDVNETVETTK